MIIEGVTTEQTAFACDVADSIFGSHRVLRKTPFYMGSEDFAVMSQERPGCYLLLGTACASNDEGQLKDININDNEEAFTFENGCLLHQSNYDFNDEAIPLGATLYARLAEEYL